eukprot:scpid34459/ scgid5766/ 
MARPKLKRPRRRKQFASSSVGKDEHGFPNYARMLGDVSVESDSVPPSSEDEAPPDVPPARQAEEADEIMESVAFSPAPTTPSLNSSSSSSRRDATVTLSARSVGSHASATLGTPADATLSYLGSDNDDATPVNDAGGQLAEIADASNADLLPPMADVHPRRLSFSTLKAAGPPITPPQGVHTYGTASSADSSSCDEFRLSKRRTSTPAIARSSSTTAAQATVPTPSSSKTPDDSIVADSEAEELIDVTGLGSTNKLLMPSSANRSRRSAAWPTSLPPSRGKASSATSVRSILQQSFSALNASEAELDTASTAAATDRLSPGRAAGGGRHDIADDAAHGDHAAQDDAEDSEQGGGRHSRDDASSASATPPPSPPVRKSGRHRTDQSRTPASGREDSYAKKVLASAKKPLATSQRRSMATQCDPLPREPASEQRSTSRSKATLEVPTPQRRSAASDKPAAKKKAAMVESDDSSETMPVLQRSAQSDRSRPVIRSDTSTHQSEDSNSGGEYEAGGNSPPPSPEPIRRHKHSGHNQSRNALTRPASKKQQTPKPQASAKKQPTPKQQTTTKKQPTPKQQTTTKKQPTPKQQSTAKKQTGRKKGTFVESSAEADEYIADGGGAEDYSDDDHPGMDYVDDDNNSEDDDDVTPTPAREQSRKRKHSAHDQSHNALTPSKKKPAPTPKKQSASKKQPKKSRTAAREDSDAEDDAAQRTSHRSAGGAPALRRDQSLTYSAMKRSRMVGESPQVPRIIDVRSERRGLGRLKKGESAKAKQGGKTSSKKSGKTWHSDNDGADHVPVGASVLPVDKNLDAYTLSSQPAAEGVRRSGRTRVRPLKYWANEVLAYEGDNNGGESIVGVTQPLMPPPNPTMTPAVIKQMSRTAKPKTKRGDFDFSTTQLAPGDDDPVAVVVNEKGDFGDMCIIASTTSVRSSLDSSQEKNGVRLAKCLSLDNIEAGVIEIKPHGRKTTGFVSGSALVFHVLSGQVGFTVSGTESHLYRGSIVIVPPYNSYSFKNMSEKVTFMTLTQVVSTS